MNKWLFLISPLLMITQIIEAAQGEDKTRPAAALPQAPALDSSHLVDTLLGLVLVLAVMLLLPWLVKRYLGMPGLGKGARVQVLGGVSLGPRERAVLIAVEGERLLLGVAPGRVQTLHVLGPVDPPHEIDGESFAEQLEQAGGQAEQGDRP